MCSALSLTYPQSFAFAGKLLNKNAHPIHVCWGWFCFSIAMSFSKLLSKCRGLFWTEAKQNVSVRNQTLVCCSPVLLGMAFSYRARNLPSSLDQGIPRWIVPDWCNSFLCLENWLYYQINHNKSYFFELHWNRNYLGKYKPWRRRWKLTEEL